MNCSSTGRFVPPSVYIGFSFDRVSGGTFKPIVFDGLGGKRDGCFLGEPTCRRPVLLRPAPHCHLPCTGPPRPARGMSGFWIRQIELQNENCFETKIRLWVAVHRPAATRPSYVLVFDSTSIFLDMPCMKKVCSDKKAMVHWSATRNEARPSSRG